MAKQGQLQPPPVLHQCTVPCMDSFRLLSNDDVSAILTPYSDNSSQRHSPKHITSFERNCKQISTDCLLCRGSQGSISQTSFEENKFRSC